MDAEFQFLRLPQVLERLGISKSALYARLDPNSKYYDPTFPRQHRISPSLRRSAVVWIAHEVSEWQKKLVINKS
jgi:prophage regulatory protein